MSKNSSDYKVGYGKPPKTKQFKKGQSGNPKGRPKGTRNIATILAEALDAKVTVRDGDQVRKMSSLEALINNLAVSALKGDPRARQAVLKLMQEYQVGTPPPEAETPSGRHGVLVVPEMLPPEAWDLLHGGDENLVEKVHAWREFEKNRDIGVEAEAMLADLD